MSRGSWVSLAGTVLGIIAPLGIFWLSENYGRRWSTLWFLVMLGLILWLLRLKKADEQQRRQ